MCVPSSSWLEHFLSFCCWLVTHEWNVLSGTGIRFLLRSEYLLNGNPVVTVWWDGTDGGYKFWAVFWELHLFDFISRLNWSLFVPCCCKLYPLIGKFICKTVKLGIFCIAARGGCPNWIKLALGGCILNDVSQLFLWSRDNWFGIISGFFFSCRRANGVWFELADNLLNSIRIRPSPGLFLVWWTCRICLSVCLSVF